MIESPDTQESDDLFHIKAIAFLPVYVDAHDACNDLTFQLGQAGVGTQLAQRAFSIKVGRLDYSVLRGEAGDDQSSHRHIPYGFVADL